MPVVAVAAGDPESSRLVYAMVIGLIVVGVALVVLAIWILRQTRPDLDVLAPLERMGDGDWKRRDPSTQRRMLDEVRPDGAEPLVSQPPPPPIDADFEQADHPVTSFSDLGPGVGGEIRGSTPMHTDADIDAGLPDAEPDPEPELELEPGGDASDDADADADAGGESDVEVGSQAASDEALSDPRA
jgi:hypothetical protein